MPFWLVIGEQETNRLWLESPQLRSHHPQPFRVLRMDAENRDDTATTAAIGLLAYASADIAH
ncbi:MAG TPA: hypothetical protein VK753_03630, partial [Xanthomonadaceae bacterium]|nr:hypothetical protein [Xanthomonadaceae bacterium]